MNLPNDQQSALLNPDAPGFWHQNGISFGKGRALWMEFTPKGCRIFLKLMEPEKLAESMPFDLVAIKRYETGLMIFRRLSDETRALGLFELLPSRPNQTVDLDQPIYWLGDAVPERGDSLDDL